MKSINPILALAFLITCSLLFSCQKEDLFVNTPPTIEDQVFSINENSPNGTIVGSVFASDIDSKQTLTYSIISGNFDDAFKIDSKTGVIYVNDYSALDFEKVTVYELGVTVWDDNKNPLSASARITINLNNVNEFPKDGLVACYTFDENANDISGNNHNGTVYGATLTTDRHNQFNSAYTFDGINNYINTFSTFDYQYRTVSFWVNIYNITSSGTHVILGQDSYLLSYGAFSAVIFDGLFTLQGAGAAGTLGATANVWYQTNTISSNRWYHIVMIRNGSTSQYYVNGNLVQNALSNTSGSTASPNANLIIGSGRTTTTQFFNGKIDDIAIYNRVLSEDEIITLYTD